MAISIRSTDETLPLKYLDVEQYSLAWKSIRIPLYKEGVEKEEINAREGRFLWSIVCACTFGSKLMFYGPEDDLGAKEVVRK